VARHAGREWGRRYPPLAGAVVGVVLALFVLPSALNVPQTNPSQTLEFAPIPPEDDDPPPPAQAGNVSQLALGTSSTTPANAQDGGGAAPLPPPVPEGTGARPVTKNCVGNPPRQTEDRMSPPCVAHFEGDNGGATAPGVTGDEIVVLAVEDSGFTEFTSRTFEERPVNRCFDIDAPPSDEEHLLTRALRAYSRYFNHRYQTYGRHVHFYQCWTNRAAQATTPESARAEMLEWIQTYRPFATMQYTLQFEEEYIREAARNGVMTFRSRTRQGSFYREYPGLIWSYGGSLEIQARLFGDYVCSKVVPYPVSFSGNGDAGAPRKLGLLYTDNTGYSQSTLFAQFVREHVEGCGGRFEATGTVPTPMIVGPGHDGNGTSNRTSAQQNMARFQNAGVTTVIWAQGYDSETSQAAANQDYYPEWVVAGDARLDGWAATRHQDKEVWSHAFAISGATLAPPIKEGACYRAVSEGDPDMIERDRNHICTNFWYEHIDYRHLFTAIQVAGPRLTVTNVDRGFHAIPPQPSTDPAIPACFYEPGDYTCVKDGVSMWWDPYATPPGEPEPGAAEEPDGCYRMAEGGQRHFAGQWPEGDVIAQRSPDDPCTSFAGVETVESVDPDGFPPV